MRSLWQPISKSLFRGAVVALTCSCAASLCAQQASPQTTGAAVATPPPASVEVAYSAFGKRVVKINDKVEPLCWAYGLKDPGDVEKYAAVGFNTAVVFIEWRKDFDWDQADKLVDAVAKHKLHLIVALDLRGPQGEKEPTLVTPTSEPYIKIAQLWIAFVVKRYKDNPALIGWALQDDPAQVIADTDYGFRSYLLKWYGNLERINYAWQMKFPSIDAITEQGARSIDANIPPGFARPSLDLALYHWRAYYDLCKFWADEVHKSDSSHPVFSGRLCDYKSIISAPDEIQVLIPDLVPGQVEVDSLHNPQGIDIARRANRFVAIPTFTTAPSQYVSDPRALLPAWVDTALLHGASGFAIDDWSRVAADDGLQKAVKECVKHLTSTDLVEREPTPSAAFLYEPIADGQVLQDRPLYGYAAGLSPGEPSNLFYTYRSGSRYGQIDYIDANTLSKGDLSRYGVIFAPLAIVLPQEAQTALARYVAGGGVVVADLGIGSGDAGNNLLGMPPVLQDLFAVAGIERLIPTARNMRIINPSPLFPSLQVGMQTTGDVDGQAFSGYVGMSRLLTSAVPFGLLYRGNRGKLRPASGTVTVNPVGNGAAVFAPVRLWADWLPMDSVYALFHNDLLRRHALVDIVNSRSLIPLDVEAAVVREGVAFANHTNKPLVATAETIGANNLLMTDAAMRVSAAETPLNGEYHRLAATPVGALARREVPMLITLTVGLQPGEMKLCRMVPVQLLPVQQSLLAQVVNYGKDQIVLSILGQDAQVTATDSGKLAFAARVAGRGRLIIGSGDYKVAPNSLHHVAVTDIATGKSQTTDITADDAGRLTIKGEWTMAQVKITPATASAGK